MIRELLESDRNQTMDFIKEKPAENLFMIGDIEAFGFDEDFQDVWGDFDGLGNLKAVLLRYRENFIVYAPNDFDAAAFADIIEKSDQKTKMISGISEIVHEVQKYLTKQPSKTREFYYAKCESLTELEVANVDIKLADIKDIPRIIALHDQTPEFDARDGREESMTRNMEAGISRTYFVEDGETIVSTAMTTAENSMSAMVIGVATHKDYMKKGYASACMTRLCKDLLSEGKSLCLFYDNPAAGKIYKRLGFVDIGKWSMNQF
ncbi:hypothetical protein HNQ94_002467 [Salirhabdus euzebyi]|uniref:N-acetyltransferase domain-containing protein n=1 Tax=Salirhabdus euzebyi TaxID=394506 RepID=A0A841Q6H8_9BACI|nr:GNAT family N-acetyltransferase [Salirhabdus euzebyi]MBB6454016.1 hypothetical protein [Salirhabdus euzebyi]